MARLILISFASALLACASAPAKPSAPAETEISIGVAITGKNNLRVSGSTNLPDDAVLQISVTTESGAPFYSIKATVRGGAYAHEFANATRLPRGPYLVEVRFAPAEQNRASIAKLKEKSARKVCSQ